MKGYNNYFDDLEKWRKKQPELYYDFIIRMFNKW